MRYIEMDTWPRREHFQMFVNWSYPYFSMCANVDLTAFYPALKERQIPFTLAIIYAITRTANAIPEFRYRIRGEQVVEHELVHPSAAILTEDDLFGFCDFEYAADLMVFVSQARQNLAYAKHHRSLRNEPGQDDRLFMSPIPWVSFTSFIHPINLKAMDSVPRFAWGRYFQENHSIKMPLNVQAHHALMDGIHMGNFYNLIQDYLLTPDFIP